MISCTSDDIISNANNNDIQLSLQLTSNELTSRVIVAGKDELKENWIETADLFLFSNETTESVFYKRYDIKQNSSAIIDDIENIGTLFATQNECIAYVIANYPYDDLKNGMTIKELKNKPINSNFQTVQASFVMDGQGTIIKENNKLSGTIPLNRAASKIDLTINTIKNIVHKNGKYYRPKYDGIYTGFYNGVANAVVNASSATNTYTKNYFNVKINDESNRRKLVNNAGKYMHEIPFYSYSSQWDSGDVNAPYLMLYVPWVEVIASETGSYVDENGNKYADKDGNEITPSYYQIPINEKSDNPRTLLRNYYYKVLINVGILGSSTIEEPEVLFPSYLILNWSTHTIDADLKEYKYLVVDQNYVIINNKETVSVNYATSHEVTAVITSITVPDYSTTELEVTTIYSNADGKQNILASETTYKNANGDSKKLLKDCSITWNNGVLTLNHSLVNNPTGEGKNRTYDYVPYTITVNIYHTNDKEHFIEEITFVQYPAFYIEGESATKEGTTGTGTVIINNNTGNSDSWWGVSNKLNNNLPNPNMYVITITAFNKDFGKDYIIGDPRSTVAMTPTNDFETDYNGKNIGTYYPTWGDPAHENFVAPKFRTCSGYSNLTSSGDVNLEEAVYRCSAYQEAGRPAGRWRVPTKAEMEIMLALGVEGKIPLMFNVNADRKYYAATGAYRAYSNGTFEGPSTNGNSVRCVYDEWLWENDNCPINQFTWGNN